MPAGRLSMRRIRELLRLRSQGHSIRRIAESLGIGRTTVSDYVRRAGAAGLRWPLPDGVDDAALERRLFVSHEEHRPERPLPDWTDVHCELRRKHVTLALLWQEYKAEHPDGYEYSQFCDRYRRWAGRLEVWMRQSHRAGEKVFVDFSGDGIPWVDRASGEVKEAQLFVSALGASSCIFARATRTQQLPDWIECQARAFAYYGGVTRLVVPDQPRTAVTRHCRYDPDIHPAYTEFARHYGTCVMPARPRKPRDKAKVEASVLVAQRWIIAALRNRTFYSIAEINEAIAELLERINRRKMRRLGKSRRELLEEIDRPALLPLPESRYEFADWKLGARVNLDYHVEFSGNYYSVPYHHAQKLVDVRGTRTTVEIFLDHKRIASHARSWGKHVHVTCREHMPKSHRKHLEWSPSRLIHWAQKTGPATAQLIERIMSERPHPEQGYRACLGILRLSKQYGDVRLEKASRRALACRSHSYRAVASILKHRLEDQPLPTTTAAPLPRHENVRGGQYYS